MRPIDASRYRNIVVLTGAGISVGSGLRPYRGPGGIWEEFNVEEYGHIDTLRAHPEKTWRHYGALRPPVRAAEPNAGHLALARFEAALRPDQGFLLVTQNVDGLHGRAGSRSLVEFHGNLGLTRCTNDGCGLEPFEDLESHAGRVPVCPLCGSPLRPHIVLFGEQIPVENGWRVQRALEDCDLFVAVGTSGLVWPAANFVRVAASAGARTLYVNLEPLDPANPAFQEEHLGKAEEILPQLLGVDA